MARFSFATAVHGTWAVVALRGECDVHAIAELEPELLRLADRPELDVVALDLRALDFLDSAGASVVVRAAERLEADDRRLVLVRGTTAVQRVFELERLTERLEFVDVF